MKYLFILTHVEEAWNDAPGDAERAFEQYMALDKELKAEEKLIETRRLRPAQEAKTIRNLSKEKRATTTGPWTSTAEVMGGYYVLECTSMDEALTWAQRMPNYGHGSIEIRPVWE